jgi:hypothetical protein
MLYFIERYSQKSNQLKNGRLLTLVTHTEHRTKLCDILYYVKGKQNKVQTILVLCKRGKSLILCQTLVH